MDISRRIALRINTQLDVRALTLVNLTANYANTVFSAITGIVMVPMFLRYLGPNVYGGWIATGSLVSAVSICDMGLNLIITQKLSLAYAQNDKKSFSELVGTSVMLSIGIAGVIGIVAWILASFAPQWVNLRGDQAVAVTAALKFTAIGLSLSFCVQNVNAVYQALHAPIIPACLTFTSVGVGVGVSWFGLHQGLGVRALGLSVALRQVLPLAVSLPPLVWLFWEREIPLPKFGVKRLGEFVRAAVPTFFGRSIGLIAANCQEFLIGVIISPVASASYSLTKRLPELCSTVLSPIASSAFPALSAAGSEQTRCYRISKDLLSLSTFVATWMVGVCMVVNESFVITWVGESQFGGKLLTYALGAAILINARFQLLGIIGTSQGFFKATALWGILQSTIQVLLLTLLVYLIGPLGLPLATSTAALLVWGSVLPGLLNRKFGEGNRLVWLQFWPSILGLACSIGVGAILPVQHSFMATGITTIVASLLLGTMLLWLLPASRLMVLTQVAHFFGRWRSSTK